MASMSMYEGMQYTGVGLGQRRDLLNGGARIAWPTSKAAVQGQNKLLEYIDTL